MENEQEIEGTQGHEGVQEGESALGEQEGAESEESKTGDSDSAELAE